jgi:signal transduction histidine kinase
MTIRPPLTRSRSAWAGGVCSGLARHLGWNLTAVRIVVVLLCVAGGAGVLMYLWLWALVPMERTDDTTAVHRVVPVAALFAVTAAGGVVAELGWLAGSLDRQQVPLTNALVIISVGAVVSVIWNLAFDRADAGRSAGYALAIRISAAVLLLVGGSSALAIRPGQTNAVIGVAMIVLGVAVLVAPRVVRLWTELLAERSRRAREEQRSEIAAHLHDSVLQTLALIQNRAGASSEVARIARAQERELRDWLFTGDDPTAVDLAAELRRDAAAIELDFPVRIDVVTAGESVGHYSSALVAAAREAMLNAARHAGGDVSVYVETTPGSVDIFVRDRGTGVDLDTLPADRLGIRESIIGRMTRAGGSASVRPGVGDSGTEVHLHLGSAS